MFKVKKKEVVEGSYHQKVLGSHLILSQLDTFFVTILCRDRVKELFPNYTLLDIDRAEGVNIWSKRYRFLEMGKSSIEMRRLVSLPAFEEVPNKLMFLELSIEFGKN